MTIVIPMAGLSQRFIDAGFNLPKYMLYIKNKSLFNLSLSGFEQYFETCRFLFIARDIYDTKLFIQKECQTLGIRNFDIVILDKPTKGQAETVFLGLEEAGIDDTEPIIIFNIDTFRKNYSIPEQTKEWDGYLEVFWGEGPNWSYAKTQSPDSTRVTETAEKIQISNYCSTGLYFFKSASLFRYAFLTENKKEISLKEYYVAPLYNTLIAENKQIHIQLIDKNEVDFCGIPNEYYDFLKKSI